MFTRSSWRAAFLVSLLARLAVADGVTVTDPDPTANPPAMWTPGTPVSVTFTTTATNG